MDPMTMSAITQVGGSLLSSLFGKNKKPTQPPMKSDPSFGVMANNVNPLPAYQNKVQAPAYQAPQPQGNGLPIGYNSYGGGVKLLIIVP